MGSAHERFLGLDYKATSRRVSRTTCRSAVAMHLRVTFNAAISGTDPGAAPDCGWLGGSDVTHLTTMTASHALDRIADWQTARRAENKSPGTIFTYSDGATGTCAGAARPTTSP